MTFVLSLVRGRPAAGVADRILLAGSDCVVGSAPECDWRLADGVAGRHCQFGHRGGQWLVVDLGGATVLNGRPLAGPAPIASGDQITIGGCIISIGEAVQSAAAAPVAGAHGASSGNTLLANAGLTPTQVEADDAALLAAAGMLLRQLVTGLVEQLAQRARAKTEMGAEATQFMLGEANPLKTLPPDRALAALLGAKRGVMPADRAVAEAFADLEAHQAATLAGMQEALAATLDRFSPTAIRNRAQNGGLMSRVLPGAKEAAFWQAYEREFDGVAKGSSDAFVELFAESFRKAYREVSSAPRRPS